jgi:ribosomal protein S18 acetylase RimI-like enzyme
VIDGLSIRPAGPDDAGELLTLQRAAYVTEAQIYGEPALPPLTETLDELRAAMAAGTLFLAARRPGRDRIVGAGRARVDGDTCHLTRLAVAPDAQGEGVGTALIAELERRHAGAVRAFALFTGHRSEANLRLYRRLGYAEVRRRPLTRDVIEVHLAKLTGKLTRRSFRGQGRPPASTMT